MYKKKKKSTILLLFVIFDTFCLLLLPIITVATINIFNTNAVWYYLLIYICDFTLPCTYYSLYISEETTKKVLLSFFCYSLLPTSIFWFFLFCFADDELLPFPSFILVITGKFDLLDVFSWQYFSYHTIKNVYWYPFVFIRKTFYCLNFLIWYTGSFKQKKKFVEMENPFSFWYIFRIFFLHKFSPMD